MFCDEWRPVAVRRGGLILSELTVRGACPVPLAL